MIWTLKQTVDIASGYPDTHIWHEALMIPGDGNAHVWEVTVNEKGEPVDLTGYSVKGWFARDDGQAVYLAGEAEGNIARVTLTRECYAIAGQLRGVMKLVKDTDTLSVCETFFTVRPALPDEYVDPGQTVPTIDELLERVKQCEEAAEQAKTAADEATTAAGKVDTAIEKCDTAAAGADTAKENAQAAADEAGAAGASIGNLTVTSENVSPSTQAEAIVTDVDGHKNIHFKLRQGAQGAAFVIKGDAYATVEALQAAVKSPAIGDQYNVGTAAPYNVYRWTGTQWEDEGKLGSTIEAIENADIDTLYNGGSVTASSDQYLDINGLAHLIQQKVLASLAGKVDAVSGKGLSANDFTDAYKSKIDTNETNIAKKVDAVAGKGLSANDFTDDYLSKVNSSVQYVEQTLTNAQKWQTLKNIGVDFPSQITVELAASGWSSGVYTVTTTGGTGDAIIGVSSDCTAEQYEAFCKAKIIAQQYTTAGVLTLKAFGTVPTIDLKASLLVIPNGLTLMLEE